MEILNGPRTVDDLRPGKSPDDRTSDAHRQLIGYTGLFMPPLLLLISGILPTLDQPKWEVWDSISSYYYSGSSSIFVGLLVTLSLFLFTYRGFKNDFQWCDRLVAVTAAVSALGVAFFPTKAPAGMTEPTWWTETMGMIHYISAVILFFMFAVFSLWLFRLNNGSKTPEKRIRNTIYLICGLVIIASMIWAWLYHRTGRPIFIPESVALMAFAVSWLVKGYATYAIKRRIGIR